jgi:hypothetical protein
MDERLASLLKTCNIWSDGEVKQVSDAVEEHGLAIVFSALKRQSIIEKDKGKYPIEQFHDVLEDKLRERNELKDR